MAAEARAMLDALMGSDRNTAMKQTKSTNNPDGSRDWDSLRTKKSCYDRDICPLYCAWGVDVYELFTNTKSDLGPNPYVVQEDGRDEYLSLPDHEKDRLGYERMLWNKLGEEVRKCDRIVMRNKEKLRQEIAKAAKARNNGKNSIDPATDVSDEMIMDAAELTADLELKEEEVEGMVKRIMEIDGEWKKLWDELQVLQKQETSVTSSDPKDKSEDGTPDETQDPAAETDTTVTESASVATKEANTASDDDTQTKTDPEKEDTTANTQEDEGKGENDNGEPKEEEQKEKGKPNKSDLDKQTIKQIKSKLYSLSSEQQKIAASLAILTSQKIVPLRDSLQSLTKQMHYVKTDTSSDKTVCEVSGNFMSSRDAEERIAAHYAGKQYVGWKMVRDKFKELDKKFRTLNSRHGSNHGHGHGRGPPPPRHGSARGGYGHPPPSDYGRGGGRQGGGYHQRDHGGYDRRRERSRSRDRNDRGPRGGSGGGGGYNRSRDRDRGYRR